MSTQIEELEKLFAKEIEHKIPKNPKEDQEQAIVMVREVSLEDLQHINVDSNAPMKEQAKGIIKLISLCLGVDETTVSKLSSSYITEIMGIIMDSNDFGDSDKVENKLSQFIKQKQILTQQKNEHTGEIKG